MVFLVDEEGGGQMAVGPGKVGIEGWVKWQLVHGTNTVIRVGIYWGK